MSIREQIDARFRQARLDRDERTKNVIGMLKNKMLVELKSGKGLEETDDLWREVLSAYAKQARKSIPELEKAGARGREAIAEAEFEIAFCDEFLPKKLDRHATEALARKYAAEHGITDGKMAGKLMGLLMKNHRDEIEGDLAREIVHRVLNP